MSSAAAANIDAVGTQAREACVEAAWRQWARLGATGLPGADARAGDAPPAVIDPEALLVLSCCVAPAEWRLRDFMRWWAQEAAPLLSVQRTKTLLRRFPPEARAEAATFARWAVEAGDKRWQRYVSSWAPEGAQGGEPPARTGKGGSPRLMAPPALVLRLRAGFGVSAKADALAYLLGMGEQAATVSEAAEATAFARATMHGTLRDLARAGFVHAGGGTARYHARRGAWGALLGLSPAGHGGAAAAAAWPRWRHWAQVFAFLAATQAWAKDARQQTAYVASSRARDLVEAHASALALSRLSVPRMDAYRGADFLGGFADAVTALAQWTLRHA
jgi:hypothetical protein